MRKLLPLAALWSLAAAPIGAAETWVQVQSPHFTIVCTSGEGSARKIAWEFEQVRLAFQKLWP